MYNEVHNQYSLFRNILLDLPSKLDTDDGLEEVVDDFDEVGGVDDETGLQVLSVPGHKEIIGGIFMIGGIFVKARLKKVPSIKDFVETPQPG